MNDAEDGIGDTEGDLNEEYWTIEANNGGRKNREWSYI